MLGVGMDLDEALAAIRRIDKVDVDQGETGCRTPDVSVYIAEGAASKKPGKSHRADVGSRRVEPERRS
jgi:hypothetical protein